MSDEVELIGGREKREIRLVAYDPSWPVRFEQERARIVEALGPIAQRIDHVGSTAVRGLCAKPIIDIDLSVEDPDVEATYLPALKRAGYLLRVRSPGHRMVRSAGLDVHVHVCGAGSPWERRHLLFRDWLRTDATDRARYGQVKQAVAEREWADMNEYAAAKNQVIQEITERAERWARLTSWSAARPAPWSSSRGTPSCNPTAAASVPTSLSRERPVRPVRRTTGEEPLAASPPVTPYLTM